MTTPGSNGPDQPSGGTPGWGQPPAGPPGGYSPPPPPPGGTGPGQYQPQPGQGQYPPQGGVPYPPQDGAPYPPQGGAPYPPQGGATYPPQGGAPYPPQGGAPFPPQAGGPGTPPKSGPPKWLIPVIAGVVLVAAALTLFAVFGNSGAEVGDCVATSGINEVEEVDCDDDSAVAKVVGIADGELSYREYTQSQPSDFCGEFDTYTHFWEGEEGEDGRVVCVELI